jgi:hypothetical protein
LLKAGEPRPLAIYGRGCRSAPLHSNSLKLKLTSSKERQICLCTICIFNSCRHSSQLQVRAYGCLSWKRWNTHSERQYESLCSSPLPRPVFLCMYVPRPNLPWRPTSRIYNKPSLSCLSPTPRGFSSASTLIAPGFISRPSRA